MYVYSLAIPRILYTVLGTEYSYSFAIYLYYRYGVLQYS